MVEGFKIDAIDLSSSEQEYYVWQLLDAMEKKDRYLVDYYWGILWGSIIKFTTKMLNMSYGHIIRNPAFPDALEDMKTNAAINIYKDIYQFNPNMGAFTTFCRPRIFHAGITYIAEEITHRTENYEEKAHKINRCINELADKGVEYNEQIIHDMTGIPIATIKAVLLQNDAYLNTISLNSQEFFDEYFSEKDLKGLTTSHLENPEQAIIDKEEREHIQGILKELDNVTAKVIKMSFGISCSKLSDSEISSRLGITTSEVKQRYNSGIRSMKKMLSSDPTYSDRVQKSAQNLRRKIHLIPTDVSQNDIEDANSFMQENLRFVI